MVFNTNADICDAHLNLGVDKEFFRHLSVSFNKTCMMDTYTKGQGQLQVGILHPSDQVLHLKRRQANSEWNACGGGGGGGGGGRRFIFLNLIYLFIKQFEV